MVTFEERFPEWLEDNVVVPDDEFGEDDATRDGPPTFDDRWHAQNEAFSEEERDSDGWPQVDVKGDWDDSFKAPIVSISKISSSDSDDDDGSSEKRNNRKNPRQLIVMRVKQRHIETREDQEEPRGSNGDVLTLASAAAASIYSSPALSIPTPTTKESPKQLYKRLPSLLCKTGRSRSKEIGAFPVAKNFRPIETAEITAKGVDPSKIVKPQSSPGKVNRLCFDSVDRDGSSASVDVAPYRSTSSSSTKSAAMYRARRHDGDKMLPTNTLDFFCRDSGLVVTSETIRQQSILSRSEEDTASSSSYEDDEEDCLTVSSLPNGVADSKLAKSFFLKDIQEESSEDEETYKGSRKESRDVSSEVDDVWKDKDTTGTCARDEGSIEAQVGGSFLSADDTFPAKPRFSHLRPSGRKVADRQKWLNEVFKRRDSITTSSSCDDTEKETPKPPAVDLTPVSGAIAKFGGSAARKTRVQRRREELERKAAEIRAKEGSNLTLKTKWEVCNGSYRKKVVLSSLGTVG